MILGMLRFICTFIALSASCYVTLPAHASAPEYLVKRYEGGEAFAAYIIGNRYRLGIGGPFDSDKAKIWYEKSATRGVMEAQYTLAWMYSHKSQSNLDYDKAMHWLLMAERNADRNTEESQAAFEKAVKRLKWMCKNGYADFPQSHAYANDPKCMAARGLYMFNQKTSAEGLAGILDFEATTIYREKAKDYLVRALEAGELSAADTLARIEKTGWGGDRNTDKAMQYMYQAEDKISSRGHLYLARQAKDAGDIVQYLRRLELGARSQDSRAAQRLGKAYLTGDDVARDPVKGLTYLLISGRRGQFTYTGRFQDRLDAYIPLISKPPALLVLFRDDETAGLLEQAHQSALEYAAEHKFSKAGIRDINEVHKYAVNSYAYYHERGGVWHGSAFWTYMFWRSSPILFLLLFGIFIWLILRKHGARLVWWQW